MGVQGSAISGGFNSSCELLPVLRVTGRVGSLVGKDLDGAGDSQSVKLGMVSSTAGGDIGSWISCGDENEDFEDSERIIRRRLCVTRVWVEAISIG